jgi:hypothetical protein
MSWAGTSWISRPSRRTVPVRGLIVPLIVRSVVDLPAPFEPMRVTISPLSTVREIPSRARMFP